ncbi:MAG: Fur family transcriptional regulator [Candidatus Palauibacterales bacterium]|nr:Fur family transcriptional regulator [Candidatus Palauibacterales bacterium]MDP2530917.1 Fur family transcriptional regulator [Candidatus Palauibacterales bacterium]MDP2584971.1 Fur family transcriptional regulator [Candidatus Palauibacterales bacterium]
MADTPEDLRPTLREAGLRATAQRIAVLGVLRDSRGHLSADRVAEEVRGRLGTVSTQAVYDVLDALTSKGLARRIEPAGSPALFEGRVADNHHHVVCRVCGAVEDIDCVVGAAPCMQASDTRGYVLDEAEITFWGLCPDCQETAAESPEASASS